MVAANVYRPALMCPLCHDEYEAERSLREHLHEDHSTSDLVDFVVTVVDAEETGPLVGTGR